MVKMYDCWVRSDSSVSRKCQPEAIRLATTKVVVLDIESSVQTLKPGFVAVFNF